MFFLKSPSQNVYIPDWYFKSSLISIGVDKNNDREIQVSEAEGVDSIILNVYAIKDLTGIETFLNLKVLNCENNKLTTLDLSKNIQLKELYCSNNQLKSINLNNNTKLAVLYCSNNQLTTLDISKNIALTYLGCSNNQFTNINTTKNKALEFFSCCNNQIVSLDLKKNKALIKLWCTNNQLTSLNVSKNRHLRVVKCTNNPYLQNICVNKFQLKYKTYYHPGRWKKDAAATWSRKCK